jgi:hypothetical protein
MDELLDKIDKKGLLDALLELWSAPMNSLFDEENSKNAIKWTVT